MPLMSRYDWGFDGTGSLAATQLQFVRLAVHVGLFHEQFRYMSAELCM